MKDIRRKREEAGHDQKGGADLHISSGVDQPRVDAARSALPCSPPRAFTFAPASISIRTTFL